MKHTLWIKSIKAFVLLSMIVAPSIVLLHGNPVWEVVPQKKDANRQATRNVSIAEKPDRYEVFVELPGGDLSQVVVNFKEGLLNVELPSDRGQSALRKQLALPGATQGPLRIERDDRRGVMVVTIPKEEALPSPSSVTTQDQQISTEAESGENEAEWMESDVAMMLGEMQRMQQQMQSMLGGGFAGLPIPSMMPQGVMGMMGMGGMRDMGGPAGGMRASLPAIEEHDDRYVVRTFLPGQDLSKVNVSIKERMLTIEARNQSQPKSSATTFSRNESSCSQAMSLPGPVAVGKMKVDRVGDELVVTLPKATAESFSR